MLSSILHTITSALLAPVIVILMAMGVAVVLMIGMLVAEFFTERRYFKLSVPQLVDDLQQTDDIVGVVPSAAC